VLVTTKGADAALVSDTADAAGRAAPKVPRAVARLESGDLRQVDAPETRPLSSLRGERVLAVAGIADPAPFVRTLEAAQPSALSTEIFPDHHPFGPGDAEGLVSRAGDGTVVVCTLKDAVKLAPLWPRAVAPLWYVSQRVVVQDGLELLESVFARLLHARRRHPDPPGRAPGAVSHTP
jgi:tetraacyldisaccharide 4'-kinase